jgi:hypothetical protein
MHSIGLKIRVKAISSASRGWCNMLGDDPPRTGSRKAEVQGIRRQRWWLSLHRLIEEAIDCS